MADDFIEALAEFSVHLGAKLFGEVAEPGHQIDRTALANAILRSAVEQASKIVTMLGIGRFLSDERGDFGAIVGVIAGELFDLASLFADQKLTLSDCSLDPGDVVVRALIALKS
jgi:hypothetical protein